MAAARLRGTYGRSAIGLGTSGLVVAVAVIVPTFAEATPPKALRAPEPAASTAQPQAPVPMSKITAAAPRPRNPDEGSGCGRSFHPPVDGKLALRGAYRTGRAKSYKFCPTWSGFGHVRGRFHGGIDVSATTGTPVRAGTDGTLTYGNNPGGFGKYARLSFQHPKRGRDGTCHGSTELEIIYAHLLDESVKIGAPPRHVRAGEVVGRVGCTGNARGMCSPSPESHVHVTVQRPDARGRIDPLAFFGWQVHRPDEGDKASEWASCFER
ncbi:MAG: peptidoglycan DD-metalloendopeptidase family protein [Polyangiaceae bacterium]|nr:peptidoglycan DD-metalloendopeptidase family protein [Polyangiaceae bacterium]